MDSATEVVLLLDIYGALLTENQASVLRMRYDEDLSLGEIGETLGISRQAVHDSILKGEQQLHHFEEVLKLVKKDLRLKACVLRLEERYKHGESVLHEIQELKQLAEE